MSYLENGSTLRSMFRLMPPQRHDADPDRSEVLKYIQENLGCDLARSIRAFNSMRNKKSQVLTYDMVHRQWRGCDWVPPEDGDKITMLTRVINELKRELAYMNTMVRKHEKVIGQLDRKRPSKRRDEEEEQEPPAPEAEQQPIPAEEKAAAVEDKEEWFRAMRALAEEFEMEKKAAKEAASAPRRSPPSDSTDPTEYPWENDEDIVS
jgi:hypothetical protein